MRQTQIAIGRRTDWDRVTGIIWQFVYRLIDDCGLPCVEDCARNPAALAFYRYQDSPLLSVICCPRFSAFLRRVGRNVQSWRVGIENRAEAESASTEIYLASRQGERSVHVFRAAVAHAGVLSE
jgi:hypothetical protein